MPDKINENVLLKIIEFLNKRKKYSYSVICCLTSKGHGQSLMINIT